MVAMAVSQNNRTGGGGKAEAGRRMAAFSSVSGRRGSHNLASLRGHEASRLQQSSKQAVVCTGGGRLQGGRRAEEVPFINSLTVISGYSRENTATTSARMPGRGTL